MKKRHTLAISLLISIVVAIATAVFATYLDPATNASLFTGILAFLATAFIIHAIGLEGAFESLLSYLDLNREAIKSGLDPHTVHELMTSYSTAMASGDQLARKILARDLRSSARRFRSALEGRLVISDMVEGSDILTDLIAGAKKRISGTSYVEPSWWESAIGANYFSDLVRRKQSDSSISIERIFIYDDEHELRNLKLTLRTHVQHFNVYTIQKSRVPAEYMEDYAIFDDLYVSLSQFVPGTRIYSHDLVLYQSQDIERFKNRFAQLRVLSAPLSQTP